ncbi:unnamed protein product [Rhodiola kirilowii]
MESKHFCKICHRNFANGKSMGGHMRSHFAKLPVPPKPSSSHPSGVPNAPRLITSSPRSDSSGGFLSLSSISAHGSPAHIASSAHRVAASALGVRSSARKRSKRTHPLFRGMESPRLNKPLLDPQHGTFSSPDALVTVEDAARCLMMLSRGKWSVGKDHPQVTNLSDSGDTSKDDDALSDSDYGDEDSHSLDSMELNVFGHRCETCKKVFKSYQALGGHMRNHKRPVTKPVPVAEKREFPCEICFKVFGSGQALGGHKKVHYSMEKKLTVGKGLPEKEIPIIEIDSDSESDPEFRSASVSETDEKSSDT